MHLHCMPLFVRDQGGGPFRSRFRSQMLVGEVRWGSRKCVRGNKNFGAHGWKHLNRNMMQHKRKN